MGIVPRMEVGGLTGVANSGSTPIVASAAPPVSTVRLVMLVIVFP
jgi:hypothetical protein